MSNSTYFQTCSPSVARILLAGLILFVMISLFERPTDRIVAQEGELGDVRLWQNVLDRMRQGQSYYSAMEMALRNTGNYPLRPFWSFRLPTLACFMSIFKTNFVPRILLALLAIAMVLFWSKLLLESSGWISVLLGNILLTFSVVCAVLPSAIVWHDLWAGVLVAMSIGLYSKNRTLSVLFGLLALTLRIQVVPFIIVMGCFALFEKRFRESGVWFAALGAFVIYVTIHAYFVSKHVTDSDPSKNWIGFGGWSFIIATTRWTLPGIVGLSFASGALLPVSLFSLASWHNACARRAAATMLVYCFAFMIMGNPDNDYWGLLYSPLWAVGVACSPKTIRELCSAALENTREN